MTPRGTPRPGPLAHRPFRRLLAARTTAVLGNAVAPIALAFAVLDLTGSATDLGLVVAARSLANVAVLLLGGVLADRLPRSVILVGTSLAAAGTQAVVAALVISGTASIPALVVLGVLNGAVAAVSLPAASALVPDTVPVGELRPANALLRLGLTAGTIVGASGGAAVVALVGPGWGLAIDAAGFALAALLYSGLRLPASTRAGAPGSVLADLREGWREFSGRRWVWIVVAQFTVLNAAFVGATTVLGPVIADQSFGRAAWGLVIAAQTVGLAIGAVLALRWRPRRALAIGVALMAVTAVPVAVLGVVPALPALIVAFALGGVALEVFAIAWDQSLQTHVPREALARVYSYDMVGSFLAVPLGEALVGPLADLVGTRAVLLGCAAVIVVASLAAVASRSVRGVGSAPAGTMAGMDPENSPASTETSPPDAAPAATGRYAHGHHESVLRSHRWRTVENSAAYLLPHLAPGVSILDVGCGPGTITVDLAERVAPGRVLGVDASAEVIAQAAALDSPAEFAVADAYALPFADDSFDVVHAHQVLQHLTRPIDALREWGRVGRLVAARDVDYAGVLIHPFTEGLQAWAALYQRVHRASAGEPDAGRRLKAWARVAGFESVEVTASLWVFENAEDRAWWGGMWADRAVSSSFATVALERGLATQAELEAISAAWRAWAADEDGWLSMPHGELLAR
ncbi:methyltransferase family protein [Rathayibacter sp. PhB185]|nr:methyltransferase family protein [Rathayibacter sp. PhB186]ROS51772.1 methyltransferase family protein [Rathayibacter sp. PhB185]